MRLAKYLSLKSYCTRRGANEFLAHNKVLLNGKPARSGDKVKETDRVEVKVSGKQQPYIYIAYNKPKGIITHSARRGEREIKEVLPVKGVFPVGRLDKDSHGLIILTNDARIVERLLGPAHDHDKEYFVRTKNKLRSSFKDKMEAGVKIDDEQTLPCKGRILNDHTFKVVLTEGKKHQIRRMCVALFQEVADLQRIRIMNIQLGDIAPGSYRKLAGEELKIFLNKLGLK